MIGCFVRYAAGIAFHVRILMRFARFADGKMTACKGMNPILKAVQMI